MIAEKYFTYEEAAEELCLSVDRVKHLISEDKLHSVRSRQAGHSGTTKYIRSKEIEAYKQRKSTRSVVGASQAPTSQAHLVLLITAIMALLVAWLARISSGEVIDAQEFKREINRQLEQHLTV